MTILASYTYVHGGEVARTIEVGDDFHADLDTEGRIAGIESLGTMGWPEALISLAMSGQLVVRR